MPPEAARGGGVDVADGVELDLIDERRFELAAADAHRRREGAVAWIREAIDAGADVRRRAGVPFARGQPERAVGSELDVADGESRQAVGERSPGRAEVVGAEDAAVGAAGVDVRAVDRESGDASRDVARAAAR